MRRFTLKGNVALQHFGGTRMSFKRLIYVAVAGLLGLAASSPGYCQTEEPLSGSSPVYHVREGHNELSLIERFSSFIQHTARIKRVMDFDEEIVTVQPVELTPTQIRIYALKPGVTTVTIIDENDRTYSVEVLVEGDVRSLEAYIRRKYPNDTIIIDEINENAVRLDGWVSEPDNISEIQAIAEQHYPDVLNHMKTGGVQQVLLQCTILEVQRSKLRRLGMNFSLVRPDGFVTSTPGPITPLTTLTATGTGATLGMSGFSNTSASFGFTRPNSVFQGFIQAMREEGVLKSTVMPMIVTHNGRPANLLSGGEMPVPTAGSLGVSGVEYREFGIQLNTVPYVLGNGRVRLEVETVIRDKDLANSINIGGTVATGFKTNSANTQVEMNFGEALVIAGLTSQRNSSSAQKLPFLGELPYIGTAFSRKSSEDSETELIILITPEYVAPGPASQFAGGPGTFTDVPVDRELFFHGLLEVPKFGDECSHCQTPLSGGQCTNPECQNCHPEMHGMPLGAKSNAKPASGSVKATPASSNAPAGRVRMSSGSGKRTSEGSGLISPPAR